MRVTDLWGTKKQPTISFELFPARSPDAGEKLKKVIENLAAVEPDFVSVTFGAGGSTREGSYQLVKELKNEWGLEVVAYFACYGLGPDEITSVLNSYKELGIETILAVRGDEPKELENFQPHPDSLPHASDLLAFLKSRYDFCLGGAGYPEGHIESESKEKDLEYLKVKVQNGAEYIITNYTYDNRYFFNFVDKCRYMGIDIPILAGVMPIYSIKMMESLSNICGAAITDEIRQGLAKLPPNDNKAVVNFGIDFAFRQCKELIERGVPGIHIYTMDRSNSSVEIVNRLRNERVI